MVNNAILFLSSGLFYEFFYTDAELMSKILNLSLLEDDMPRCGILQNELNLYRNILTKHKKVIVIR